MDFLYPLLLFLVLLASVAIGWAFQDKLRERHLSRESVDSIRLLMAMLVTFSALVLGLLTSSAKERFDGYRNDLAAFGADLIELDHRMRTYGPELDGVRGLLRSYTAAAIANLWPDEAAPSGAYPHFSHGPGPRGMEETGLGEMLSEIDVAIEHLNPADGYQSQVAARLRERVTVAIHQRWGLIFGANSTVSWPFLVVLTFWLSIIFAIVGLTSPRNPLVYAVVALSALSIASPLYLILDYSDTLTGLVKLPSVALRVALEHMDRAN